MGSQRVRHDWLTLSLSYVCQWGRCVLSSYKSENIPYAAQDRTHCSGENSWMVGDMEVNRQKENRLRSGSLRVSWQRLSDSETSFCVLANIDLKFTYQEKARTSMLTLGKFFPVSALCQSWMEWHPLFCPQCSIFCPGVILGPLGSRINVCLIHMTL